MGGRLLAIIVWAGVALASALGLWVMAGGGKALFAPDLRAELAVSEFPLPTGFGVDPEEVAGFLSEILQKRTGDDIALRLALGSDGQQKLQEVVLPRLLNVVVVRSMLREVKPLANVLAMGSFRQVVTGRVEWHGKTAAEDVALTVPGLALAERDGTGLDIVTTDTGLTAVELGRLEPGAVVNVTLWTGESGLVDAEGKPVPLAKSLRLGAAPDLRGRVLLSGAGDWNGSGLETLTWARWILVALLAGGVVLGLAGLFLPVFAWRKDRFRIALQGSR